MNVRPIRTNIVRTGSTDLISFLDHHVTELSDGSILVITSKIVSLCEGRIVEKSVNKYALVRKEAELYLSPEENKYGISMTIKNDILIPAAGIDQSNADNRYVLWPKNPQKIANVVRAYLAKRFSLTYVGVCITDSRVLPLRWGTVGVCLAHSGFVGVNDFVGTHDLFGRDFEVTKVNARDGLAAAAVLVMGETTEQTPLAVIADVPFIQFQSRNPTAKELRALRVTMDDDIYGSILSRAPWEKGGSYYK